jgi:DNA repair protein RadC
MEKVREPAFYHSKIKAWPESERPREKLSRYGPAVLTDAELLALLIESGTRGITALDLARRLLVQYGSLKRLSISGGMEWQRMKGIGSARSARLRAAFEIGRRIETDVREVRTRIHSPEDLVRRLQPRMRALKHEVFQTALLDSANSLIRIETVSRGILNASVVHPREVFKPAVDHLAAAVILVHNHPSGDTRPSGEDRTVTTQMVKAGVVMGIPILDHLIIAASGYFSFAQEGLLKP